MYLIQLLLPLYDNEKQPFSRSYFEAVRNELTNQFGGVTAFVRSPAQRGDRIAAVESGGCVDVTRFYPAGIG